MSIFTHTLSKPIKQLFFPLLQRNEDAPPMRVLQGPIEIAGQMGLLSKGLEAIGIKSSAYNTYHTYLGYRDYVHYSDVYDLEYFFREAVEHFDLFHFHYGMTMLPNFEDLPKIKKHGKPMVMHHWGNDVRTQELAMRDNPFVDASDSPPAEKIDESLKKISTYIDHAIVQDFEVYPYVAPYYKHVHVLPIAFSVMSVEPNYPSKATTNPLLIHAPTNPLFKGTAQIEAAIDRLQREGYEFSYRRIEKLSNEEALQVYKEADVVIDQILCGSYGMLAVESMSMGKPVVGFIREDLKTKFDEVPPIVSANPEQIYDALRDLIVNPEKRTDIGRKSRMFVEKYHDVDVVANRLNDIYKTIVKDLI